MKQTFELEADSGELVLFREKLKALLKASGMEEKRSGEVLVAVQEALTNIIRHAYAKKSGKISVTVQDENEQVRISIRDYGKKFDLTKVPDPKLPREVPGGLGIYLIKKAMDDVYYDGSCPDGNLIHLVKFKHEHEKPKQKSN